MGHSGNRQSDNPSGNQAPMICAVMCHNSKANPRCVEHTEVSHIGGAFLQSEFQTGSRDETHCGTSWVRWDPKDQGGYDHPP